MKRLLSGLMIFLSMVGFLVNNCLAEDGFPCNPYTPIMPGENVVPPPLSFDCGNPDTISPKTSKTITITGGTPPYNWTVSGQGFSLAATQTQAKTNTLIAGSTAAGTATIKVTDHNGAMIGGIESGFDGSVCNCSQGGYVRSTRGHWHQVPTRIIFGNLPVFADYVIADDYFRTCGKYQQKQRYVICMNKSGGYFKTPDQCKDCSDYGGQNACTYSYCDPIYGCVEVLKYTGKYSQPPYAGEFPCWDYCKYYPGRGYHYAVLAMCTRPDGLSLFEWRP